MSVPAGLSIETCAPFLTPAFLKDCCPDAADIDDSILEIFIQAASDYVYEVTGRQFRGVCSSVRPFCPPCRCTCDPCCCGPYPRLDLGTDPVIEDSVVVTFEGTIIDPATYRLDRLRYLVRENDPVTGANEGWPRGRLAATDGGVDSLVVEWGHGIEPATGAPLIWLAARAVACQFAKACSTPGDCDLPSNVSSIVREGVTIDLSELSGALADSGDLGIPELRAAITAYNDKHLRTQPFVIDPESIW